MALGFPLNWPFYGPAGGPGLTFPLLLGDISDPNVPPAPGTFRALFPEFRTAPDDLVSSRLDMAAVQIDPAIWGPRAGEGQAYLAAHLLAISPGGVFARLISQDGTTVYKTRYDEMVGQVAALAYRVI